MKPRHTERGSALSIAAGVMLVVAVGTAIAALLLNRKFHDLEAEQFRLGRLAERYVNERDSLATHLEPVTRFHGYPLGDLPQTSPDEKIIASTTVVNQALEALRATVYDILLAPRPDAQPPIVQRDGLAPALAVDGVPRSFLRSLSECAPVFVQVIEFERGRADSAEGNAEVAQRAVATQQAVGQRLVAVRQDDELVYAEVIQWLNDQTAESQRALTEETARLTDLRNTLQRSISDLDRERQRVEFEWDSPQNPRNRERTLEAEISRLRADLESMRLREAFAHEVRGSHGRLMQPDPAARTGFINLGSRDNIVEGMIFRVGRPSQHGLFEVKGVVEVRRVDETMSMVEIVQAAPEWDPLVEGDSVINPFYHPRRPPVVALIGRERAPGVPVAGAEAIRLLSLYGVQVRSEVVADAQGYRYESSITPDIDFVIVTAQYESEEAYRTAVQLEIPIAQAADVLPYLVR